MYHIFKFSLLDQNNFIRISFTSNLAVVVFFDLCEVLACTSNVMTKHSTHLHSRKTSEMTTLTVQELGSLLLHFATFFRPNTQPIYTSKPQCKILRELRNHSNVYSQC